MAAIAHIPTPASQISAVVYNRYTKFNCDPDIQIELKKFFRHLADQATLDHSMKYASGDWDGFINYYRWNRVATSLFLLQREKIERKLGPIRVIDKREYPQFKPVGYNRAWAHQKEAVMAMVRHSNVGGLILNATGTGKTETTGMYFKRLQGYGVMVEDEKYLSKQSRTSLARVLDEQVGIVGMGLFEPQRITVATIQTLSRAIVHTKSGRVVDPKFREWFRKLDVMVLDEVHVALNDRSLEVVDVIQPKAVFGLTATLQMSKVDVRMRAIELAGPPIHRYGIVQGQQDGILQKGKVFQIPFHNNEYDYYPAVVVNQKRNQLVRQIVEHGLKKHRMIAVLVDRRAHLRVLDNLFQDVDHRLLSGLISLDKRSQIVGLMRERKIPLLIASRVFFKGLDIPQLDMIVDATGRPDENSAVQRFGRGVRRADAKRDLIYVDVGDYTRGGGSGLDDATAQRAASWKAIQIPVIQVREGQLPPMG